VGLTVLGVSGLVAQSFGQQKDPGVRPATTPPASAPGTAAPAATMPLLIGSIDVDRVLKDYDKFKVANETIRAESLERYNQLMKLANEGKQEQEKHERFTKGSPDQKRCEDRIIQLKAQIEALRENSEREFTQKEAETMATIYNEVAAMSRSVAKKHNMAFVVKYSDAPASGNEPNSVVAAMSRTILYSDPSVDITNEVILYLNHFYKQSGGPAPKPVSTTAPGQQPGQTNPPARQQQQTAPARPAAPGGN
jgi:Skp family chaperone for outer membrane proteins